MGIRTIDNLLCIIILLLLNYFIRCVKHMLVFMIFLLATCISPQVYLGVGIPVAFLVTAIISSLITLLITCLIMRRRESHDKFTPSVVQEPVYDPVSVSGTRPVEMKSNVAYGTTGLGANITYETVPQ